MTAVHRTTCRYCLGEDLVEFLCLGEHPPSNSFIPLSEVPNEQRYPLRVFFCKTCSLVQLLDVVPAQLIFGEYLYLSSTSKALVAHYQTLVDHLSVRQELKAGDTVVDIGCNDGIMLHRYQIDGLQRIGVEPSSVAEQAIESGLTVYKTFFDSSTALQIVSAQQPAKVITATNVFAHVDDMHAFVAGIPILLARDGIMVIEISYLVDVIEKLLFDTIYHEHLCYLTLTPMISFLAEFALEVCDVERVPFGASGPALRVVIQHQGAGEVSSSVSELLEFERSWGVGQVSRYLAYAQRVADIKDDLLQLVASLKATGAQIGGYGAPAKGNTLLNYLELDRETVEFIAETNPLKQGLVTPGSHIPIISEEDFIERAPEYALLLSWNYLEFFLAKSVYIKNGGRFIVPLPSAGIRP